MARIRSIKPEFFKHEELQDLELEHPGQYIMLVYAGLWTQCDKNGVFPCKARIVKNEILPYMNFDMQKTLDILEKGGFFIKYTSGGRDYGYIPKFNKYQYPGKAEQKSPAKYPEPPAEIADAEPFHGASWQEPEQPDNGSGTVAEPFCDGCDNHTDPEGIQEYRLIGLQEKGNSCGSSEPPFSEPISENPPEPPIEPTENTERLDFPNSQSFSADVSQKEADPSPIESSANHGETLTGGPKIAPGETAVVPSRSRSPPVKSKKTDLTPEQLVLFHIGKAAFEANEKTKAIMYQDRESTARYMKHLKTLAIRCANMVPDAPADFLRNILEHFEVMCGSGKFRDKVSFTPQSLITGFVWEKVIDSLPEAESPEDKEFVRSLFK